MVETGKSHTRFFGVRVSDAELEAINILAKCLERRRGDAVRYALRWAARELARREGVWEDAPEQAAQEVSDGK